MVLPAEAGKRSLMFIIHDGTGFRVRPGRRTINLFTCRSNKCDILNGNLHRRAACIMQDKATMSGRKP
jgi:hypothetical protein